MRLRKGAWAMRSAPSSREHDHGAAVVSAAMLPAISSRSIATVKEVLRHVSVVPVSVDQPREDEVLVRVVAAGICHTDLAVRSGRMPAPFPIVLGHEGAGVVEAVGSRVRKVAPGDHVVMTFLSCGWCETCQAGPTLFSLARRIEVKNPTAPSPYLRVACRRRTMKEAPRARTIPVKRRSVPDDEDLDDEDDLEDDDDFDDEDLEEFEDFEEDEEKE